VPRLFDGSVERVPLEQCASLLVSGAWEIWVMGSDGSNPVAVATSVDNLYPAWSHDSRRLTFASSRDGNWEIYQLDLANGQLTRLTDNPAVDTAPAPSPS
jgi:Tol biopolymer transport system component